MNRLLLSTALSIAIAGPLSAQSGSEIRAAVEARIAELNAAGANIAVAGTEIEAGDTVVLSGVRMAPDDGSLVVEADYLEFAPSGSMPGHVTVTLAPLVTFTATPPDGTAPFTIELASEGLALTTNSLLGMPDETTNTITAEALHITGGDPMHPVLKSLDIAPQGLSGNFSFNETTRDALAELSLSALDMEYTVGNPENGSTISTSSQSGPQTLRFTGVGLPRDEEEFETFLGRGGTMSLVVEGGGSVMQMTSNDPEMPLSIEGSGDSGRLEVTLDEGEFVYDARFENVSYVITPDPSVLPLPPFDAAMARGAMVLRMPVAESDSLRTARVALTLEELALGDSIWGMFDPQGTIPRDPATLEIDLTSDLRLTRPLSAMGEAMNPMDAAEIANATIERVFLSIGGAKLEAGGAVTMNNSGPFPMPSGKIDVALEGVQGLAEKLAALGLVDQMQVGMMMGMIMNFGQPGAAPDSYTSAIEFRNGSVFANGKQIQ